MSQPLSDWTGSKGSISLSVSIRLTLTLITITRWPLQVLSGSLPLPSLLTQTVSLHLQCCAPNSGPINQHLDTQELNRWCNGFYFDIIFTFCISSYTFLRKLLSGKMAHAAPRKCWGLRWDHAVKLDTFGCTRCIKDYLHTTSEIGWSHQQDWAKPFAFRLDAVPVIRPLAHPYPPSAHPSSCSHQRAHTQNTSSPWAGFTKLHFRVTIL